MDNPSNSSTKYQKCSNKLNYNPPEILLERTKSPQSGKYIDQNG